MTNAEDLLKQAGFAWLGVGPDGPQHARAIGNGAELLLTWVRFGWSVTWTSHATQESYNPVGRRDSRVTSWPLEKCLKWARRVERLKSKTLPAS